MGTVAVDFDDTLRDSENGYPIKDVADLMRSVAASGHQIIIWTGNTDFDFIRKWMAVYKIPYHSINKYPHEPDIHSTEMRKLMADVYIDDRAVNPHDGIQKILEVFNKYGIK